jgi:hypothetical protein
MVLGKLTALPTGSSSTQNFGDKNILEEIILPDTLNTIGQQCFYGYAKQNILIPQSVTNIGAGAFYNCSTSTSDIVLPNLSECGNQAFLGTGFKRALDLGSITYIGWQLFYKGKVEFVVIPETVTMVYNSAFLDCPLTTLIVEATIPPTLQSTDFIQGTPIEKGNGAIYVPDSSVTAYREASGWSAYASRIKPLSEYVE